MAGGGLFVAVLQCDVISVAFAGNSRGE
jgi:hypothetical protein